MYIYICPLLFFHFFAYYQITEKIRPSLLTSAEIFEIYLSYICSNSHQFSEVSRTRGRSERESPPSWGLSTQTRSHSSKTPALALETINSNNPYDNCNISFI